MAVRNYIDPRGYWASPEGGIRRMGDEDGAQRQIVTRMPECSDAEWELLIEAMKVVTYIATKENLVIPTEL